MIIIITIVVIEKFIDAPITVKMPHAGSGVVRIDPLHFLVGCHTRRLNQALFVLSLGLGFFWCMYVVLLSMDFLE